MQCESTQYDVIIVGAGLAGLAAAIRIKQLAAKNVREVSVCVLDKRSDIGAANVRGALMAAHALDELLPDWRVLGAPLSIPVLEERFLFLSATKAYDAPDCMLPTHMRRHDSYIVSLDSLTRRLCRQAHHLGVALCTGVAATGVLFHDNGGVKGLVAGNTGATWLARYTLVCEDMHDPLGKQLVARYGGSLGRAARADAIGITEVWEVDPCMYQSGLVVHTAGWPSNSDSFGGVVLYHMDRQRISVDYVARLAHESPYCLPHEEFKRFKNHPAIHPFFEGGWCLAYDAQTLTSDPLPALPKLIFPGGALIERDAGFSDTVHNCGAQTAIQSGLGVANAAFAALAEQRDGSGYALSSFDEKTNHAA